MCRTRTNAKKLVKITSGPSAESSASRSRKANMRSVEDNAFLAIIVTISLAFAWILWPFYGAVM